MDNPEIFIEKKNILIRKNLHFEQIINYMII